MNTKVQKALFGGTSQLTRYFPVAGARFLDATVRPLVGSSMLSGLFNRHNRETMKGIQSFRRLLVISDSHIGDAVIWQCALTTLRDFFPDAEIDYVVNRAAAPLVIGNPEASCVIPLFSSGMFPSESEIVVLAALIKQKDYDFCLCFSPFIESGDLVGMERKVVHFVSHAPTLVRNENDDSQVNHFIYQGKRFIRSLLNVDHTSVREDDGRGVRVTLSDEAVVSARDFVSRQALAAYPSLVMFNPDTASKYTLVPFETQAEILEGLAQMDATILVGEGHTDRGIGNRLFQTVSPSLREKLRVVPAHLPLDAYAALIDLCDVFISGDTGPLHIAAARRYSRSGNYEFRNRTAVLSLFGATPGRMSGYDSFQSGYFGANQDAPSWSFTGSSPCRNITCLNKLFKTCETPRCFVEVDREDLLCKVKSYLEGVRPFPISKRWIPLSAMESNDIMTVTV